MAWTTGSLLMLDLIKALNKARVFSPKRKLIYASMLKAFAQHGQDADVAACVGVDASFDAAFADSGRTDPEAATTDGGGCEEDEDHAEE